MTTANELSDRKVASYLERHPVFEGVASGVLETLTRRCRARVVQAGQRILTEEDSSNAMLILLRGSVREISSSADGQQVVIEVLKAPAVTGATWRIPGFNTAHAVEAMEPVTYLAVPPEAIESALETSHALCRNLLRDVTARLSVLTSRQKFLALHSVTTQLAHVLLSFAEVYGVAVEGGVQLRIPMSQTELARSIGVTRRSVARTMREWREQDLVAQNGRHVVLLDSAGLRKLVEETPISMIYSSDLSARSGGHIQRRAPSSISAIGQSRRRADRIKNSR